ncbi:hypothetical protein LR48_Vigan05g076700 [Vigna angularis]|uniref:Uncharacterized protein n=1 Tax=Phaseolus angularis TaxID=3914 RepID=A0A0L9UK65_PHAAN|nr:hypothetical protein LR48_Vigan05g076700 [Vigna angularis]
MSPVIFYVEYLRIRRLKGDVKGQLPEHGEDGEDDIIGGGVGDGKDDIIGGGVGDGEDDIIGGGVDGGVGDVQDEFDVSSWVGSDEDASVNEDDLEDVILEGDDLEDVILEGDEEPEQEESEGSLFAEVAVKEEDGPACEESRLGRSKQRGEHPVDLHVAAAMEFLQPRTLREELKTHVNGSKELEGEKGELTGKPPPRSNRERRAAAKEAFQQPPRYVLAYSMSNHREEVSKLGCTGSSNCTRSWPVWCMRESEKPWRGVADRENSAGKEAGQRAKDRELCTDSRGWNRRGRTRLRNTAR